MGPEPFPDGRYNIDLPNFHVLRASLRAFDVASMERPLRAHFEDPTTLYPANQDHALVKELLGDWYSGRPNIWQFRSETHVPMPTKSLHEDPERIEALVRSSMERAEDCHAWISGIVEIIERHQPGLPAEPEHANDLDLVLIELVEYLWTLPPDQFLEEAWHAETQQLARLVIEAAGGEMSGELRRSIDQMSARIFESWVHPAQDQINAFASEASWAIVSAQFDRRYGEEASPETTPE